MPDTFTDQEDILLDIIGPDLFFEVSERLGGQDVYIHRQHWTEIRNRHIRQRYDTILATGTDVDIEILLHKLAEENNLCARHIRRIVNQRN